MTAHTKRIEIRWSDLDAFGHVNHARFATFLEEARDEWLQLAVGDAINDFLIRRLEVDYLSQLVHADDLVDATIELERIGSSSVVTSERITVAGDGRLAATARCVLVHTGPDHERSEPIADGLRAALNAPA
jgi:acyl-CoA thioester hydrolase